MRITVMHQYVKGLAHHNPIEAEQLARILRQIKACLWNGNLHDGQIAIGDLVMDLDEVETDHASIKALRKAAAEFQTYITTSAWMIPNYAERRQYGERVSTGFVESTVNTVVGKRFCKRRKCDGQKQVPNLCCNPNLHSRWDAAHKVPAMVSRHEISHPRKTGSLIAPHFGVLSNRACLV